jgi:hypothetical protein
MMKGRCRNLQGMESIENSMDPRAKEKYEEEHEDSKRGRKARTTSHYIENHKTNSLQSSRGNESCDEEQCMEDL